MEFQRAGVEWLCAHARGGLFDDQGLGKTPQAIVAAGRVGARRLLVVCPTVVAYNWQREMRTWAPERRVQVVTSGSAAITADTVIVTHGLVLRKAIHDQLMEQCWDLIVVDEAHFFRNPTAKRTQKLFLGASALVRQAPRCWLLSGTPMPNDPSELWAMLAGIAPERLRDEDNKLLSWKRFRDRFCVTVPDPYKGQKVVGMQNGDDLKMRLCGFALRRLKKNVLDLPPVRYGTVSLTKESAVSAEWGEIEDTLDEATRLPISYAGQGGVLQDELDDHVLAEIQRTKSFAEWRHACGLAKVDPSVEMIENDLNLGVPKIVVFAHHLDVIHRLCHGLSKFSPVCVTGISSAAKREEDVLRFQTDPQCRVFIGQLNAAGVGITLTAASDVVFVEMSFVPGDNAQATDRVVRIGQTKPVLVRYFTLANSIDEVTTRILARKSEMIREVGL